MSGGTLRSRTCARLLILLALAALGAACVTETDGHGPQVGSERQRLSAQLSLAKGYLQNKDFNRARVSVDRALQLDRNSWEAHDLLASIHMMDGEPALAEQSWKTAIRNGGGARARRNYAQFLLSNRRYADACPLLQAASTELDYTARAQVFEDLGRCEMLRGNKPAALAAYDRAIELNADQPEAVLALSELLYEQGSYEASLAAYTKFRSLRTQNARSLWLGIRLGRAMKDADAEASHALLLRNQFPDTPEYRLYQESRP